MSAILPALLDYRLGWRWLLPYVSGQKLYLSGFDKAEQAFLHKAVATVEWVQEPAQAEGWVIDTGGAVDGEMKKLMAALLGTVQWVVITGKGEVVRRLRRQHLYEFDNIHEYGLLPAATPRLAIPLAKPTHVVAALALHRPGRWIAQCGVYIAAMLARLGMNFPLRRRVLLVATRVTSSRPFEALQAGLSAYLVGEGWDYALYLGTPSDNRKTVVLPLGGGAPKIIIKIGESTQARLALQNEAEALIFLTGPSPQSASLARSNESYVVHRSLTENGHDCSLSEQMPRMIGLVENEHSVILSQEYRPRLTTSSAMLKVAVVDFLAQLSKIDRRSRPLQEVLNEMIVAAGPSCEWEGVAKRWIWRWLQRQAKKGAAVFEHRNHGDFAPWNCAWTKEGFFVFDWEESRSLALAFGDAFYFIIAPALHVAGKHDFALLQVKALALAGQVARRGGVMIADVKVHFALWLLGKMETHTGYAHYIEHLAKDISACIDD